MAMAGARHGGAEAFFERLAPALAGAGAEVRTLIRGDQQRRIHLMADGVPVSEAPFGGPFDLRTRGLFRRELREFRPDAVLSFMSRAAKFCPSSVRLHVGRLGGYYGLKYYRRCHALVANTPDIRRYLLDEGVAEERVHYVPNFVNEAPVTPTTREEHQTPPEAPLLLAMGRFHENKAFDVLIQALAQVPDAVLWLAGEGPLGEKLMDTAATAGVMGRIRFLGWQAKTAPLLAAADVVVIPSRREPLGNVVLEGWARRKPVVAAASEGPGQLIVDGETGLLVPVDDADALGTALNQVTGDRAAAKALAEAGHARYRAEFSQEKVVAAWMDLFGRLRADPPRGRVGG